MPWISIRTADREDRERLDLSARRFYERHRVEIDPSGVYDDLDGAYDLETLLIQMMGRGMDDGTRSTARYLYRLWKRCASRALRAKGATGIAYGSVGYHQEG